MTPTVRNFISPESCVAGLPVATEVRGQIRSAHHWSRVAALPAAADVRGQIQTARHRRVVWPASLQQFRLGYNFDQPITGVMWPASLQQQPDLGGFNRPITWVVWLVSLQELVLGNRSATYCNPITLVIWSASLQKLDLGRRFHQVIADTRVVCGRFFSEACGWGEKSPLFHGWNWNCLASFHGEGIGTPQQRSVMAQAIYV